MSIEDDIKDIQGLVGGYLGPLSQPAFDRICEAARLGAAVMGMPSGMSLQHVHGLGSTESVIKAWVITDWDNRCDVHRVKCSRPTPLEALKAARVEG